ncbi:hypothetical protein ONZ45_g11538 [Pleurotus djamor]|nr:hypothetical protein ONZ45_g11538 [Pleurotus djamor]
MSSPSTSKLFEPIKVGQSTRNMSLSSPLVPEYYSQRASTPGTFLITEATLIAPQAGGDDHVPDIWSVDQIAAWKKVRHRCGTCEGILHLPPTPPPRPLTIAEIEEYVRLYAKAASVAVNLAGFDGIEVHGAMGYLVDQFLQDVSNKRTDNYIQEIGADRTAIRLSPWSGYQEMRMQDPKPTFSYFVSELARRFPDLAYIHVVEPRVATGEAVDDSSLASHEENDFLRQIWSPRPFVAAGGYTRELSLKAAEMGDIIPSDDTS